MRRRILLIGAGGGLAALASSCGRGTVADPRIASGPTPRTWPGVIPVAKLADDQVATAQTIFVPIHSAIATADNGRTLNLACTLTVRNADPGRAIVVDAIRYHDSGGKLVRSMLPTPVQIAPLAAIDLFVGENDTTGGSTPSFVVEWSSAADAAPLFVEAVMISTAGAQGIALTSTGRVVAQRHR